MSEAQGCESPMGSENVPPNPARRKRNPFKSQERMAFPPLDDALARANGDKSQEGGMPVLTISMQALLHPESFAEAGSSQDEGGEEDASMEWEAGCLDDLVSPEREAHSEISFLNADYGDGEESGSSGEEPCMADFYVAQLEYANQHLSPVHSMASGVSGRSSLQSSPGLVEGGTGNSGRAGLSGHKDSSGMSSSLDISGVPACPVTPVGKGLVADDHCTPINRPTRSGGGEAVRTPTTPVRTPTTPASVLKSGWSGKKSSGSVSRVRFLDQQLNLSPIPLNNLSPATNSRDPHPDSMEGQDGQWGSPEYSIEQHAGEDGALEGRGEVGESGKESLQSSSSSSNSSGSRRSLLRSFPEFEALAPDARTQSGAQLQKVSEIRRIAHHLSVVRWVSECGWWEESGLAALASLGGHDGGGGDSSFSTSLTLSLYGDGALSLQAHVIKHSHVAAHGVFSVSLCGRYWVGEAKRGARKLSMKLEKEGTMGEGKSQRSDDKDVGTPNCTATMWSGELVLDSLPVDFEFPQAAMSSLLRMEMMRKGAGAGSCALCGSQSAAELSEACMSRASPFSAPSHEDDGGRKEGRLDRTAEGGEEGEDEKYAMSAIDTNNGTEMPWGVDEGGEKSPGRWRSALSPAGRELEKSLRQSLRRREAAFSSRHSWPPEASAWDALSSTRHSRFASTQRPLFGGEGATPEATRFSHARGLRQDTAYDWERARASHSERAQRDRMDDSSWRGGSMWRATTSLNVSRRDPQQQTATARAALAFMRASARVPLRAQAVLRYAGAASPPSRFRSRARPPWSV